MSAIIAAPGGSATSAGHQGRAGDAPQPDESWRGPFIGFKTPRICGALRARSRKRYALNNSRVVTQGRHHNEQMPYRVLIGEPAQKVEHDARTVKGASNAEQRQRRDGHRREQRVQREENGPTQCKI